MPKRIQGVNNRGVDGGRVTALIYCGGWLTVKLCPAILITAVRATPVLFGATEKSAVLEAYP